MMPALYTLRTLLWMSSKVHVPTIYKNRVQWEEWRRREAGQKVKVHQADREQFNPPPLDQNARNGKDNQTDVIDFASALSSVWNLFTISNPCSVFASPFQ